MAPFPKAHYRYLRQIKRSLPPWKISNMQSSRTELIIGEMDQVSNDLLDYTERYHRSETIRRQLEAKCIEGASTPSLR